MHKDLERILWTEEEISRRVSEVAEEVSAAYEGKTPLFVCVLKGGAPFFSDLARRVTVPIEEDFMAASSYGDKALSSGRLLIKKDLETDVKGRDVLLVEDVVDSGRTLSRLKELLRGRGAATVKVAAFVDKAECRTCELRPEFVGFRAGREFLVGYGMDFAERYRQLPCIGALKAELYR